MTLHTEERQTPAGLASTLMWQTQAVLHWLREIELGHEISAAEWVQLADYPAKLEQTAAYLRQLVSLYEEGKGA